MRRRPENGFAAPDPRSTPAGKAAASRAELERIRSAAECGSDAPSADGRNEIDDFRSHLRGSIELSRRRCEPERFRECRSIEFLQRSPRIQIPSVRSKVNSGEHDFLVAAIDQSADLLNNGCRRQASASSSDRRNDAERTVRVAAILDLHDRARPAAGTQMRLRLQFILEKDVAAENFGAAVQFGSLEIRIEHLERQLAEHRLVRIADDMADTRQNGEFLGARCA